MKYFILDYSIDPAVIGVRDGMVQLELVKKGFSNQRNYNNYIEFFLDYSMKGVENLGKLPPENIVLEYMKLRRGAKLTDFPMFGPSKIHDRLVSKKVQTIVSDYLLPPFRLFQSTIYINGLANNDYKFFVCPLFGFDLIDYSRSRFSIESNRNEKPIPVKANSVDDLRKHQKIINYDFLVVKGSMLKKFDLFNSRLLGGTCVSEKLKIAFLSEGVNGVDFKKIDSNKIVFE